MNRLACIGAGSLACASFGADGISGEGYEKGKSEAFFLCGLKLRMIFLEGVFSEDVL